MSTSLSLEVQPQQGDLLCWAAVASSISSFFNAQSPWTQCAIATQVLKSPGCCQSLTPCNQDSFLESALQATGNLAAPPNFRLVFQQIKAAIDQKRPIGIRIAFSISVGHFVVLSGYDDTIAGQESVTLSDPAGADNTVLYTDLLQPGGYPGGGMWTHSYFTRP
ncbi:MAG TPA: papain-like cysteine protease family protein [Bryobacteraceae bacterium]|jgi:hypothetical protein|nr:papain-like cysteine protease family protein [Bryobacteraceae bacterium]